MPRYDLILKNEKLRTYNVVGWIVVFIHIVIFVFLAFFSDEKRLQFGGIAGLVMIGLAFLLMYFFRNTPYSFSVRIFLLICTIAWISAEYYWIAAVIFVMELLYTVSTRPKLARFSETEIIYPSFPNRKISWKELNQTILKDGLLTIDMKNNKLFQQMIDESQSKVDENKFNEFCREQLKK